MTWRNDIFDRLAAGAPCGYKAGGPPTSEPTALAAIALLAADRATQAAPALNWLAKLQAPDGSVSVTATEPTPCWPTSLAVLAWVQAVRKSDQHFADNINRAVGWILEMKGVPLPQVPELGHNSQLIGWSWAAATHSWMEPTAWAVLALKATGHAEHSRTREAVQLIVDRLLPDGGCNYGNTFVLGQKLLPHLEPTGLAMVALAGEQANDRGGKIGRSLDFLQRELSADTTPISLSYGLLGLAAHRPQALPEGNAWLEAAARRELDRGAAGLTLALLALATVREQAPLLPPTVPSSPTNLSAPENQPAGPRDTKTGQPQSQGIPAGVTQGGGA